MRRAVCVLAAAASATLAAALPQAAAAAARPVTCKTVFDIPGADCSRLSVPLDRSGRVPGRVSLFSEIVRSPKPSKSAIVLFPGGPGAATTLLGRELGGDFGKTLDDHDLLLFDQRGTGRSDYLDCDVALTPTYFVPLGEDAHQLGKTVERCAKKLGDQRGFYTTRETVADLEDVRAALGIDKLTLYGVSYGTRDAIAYAQAFPGHVDRVVLDSIVTDAGLDPFQLNKVHALPRFLRGLCRGGGCDGITTDPVADLATLVSKLESGAMRSQRPVSLAGCAIRVPVTRSRLFDLIQQADEDPGLAAQLPVAIAEAANGRPFQLSELEAASSPFLFGCFFKKLIKNLVKPPAAKDLKDDVALAAKSFSTAEQMATLCEESPLPWPRDAPPSARGRYAEDALAAMPDADFAPLDRATVLAGSLVPLCKFWRSAAAEPAPAPSGLPDLPVLLVAGLDDLRTPAEDALALARTTPHGHLLLVPDVGHSVIDSSACARRGFAHFMASEPISECHRYPQHRPAPAHRVKSLQSILNALLKNLPVPKPSTGRAR